MSERRPQWTIAIQRFLYDDVIDEKYGWPDDDSADELHSRIEKAVNDILCGEYGHVIEDDQCGIPEHRYCVYCQRLASQIEEST